MAQKQPPWECKTIEEVRDLESEYKGDLAQILVGVEVQFFAAQRYFEVFKDHPSREVYEELKKILEKLGGYFNIGYTSSAEVTTWLSNWDSLQMRKTDLLKEEE